jgi:NAD/NADP transhydrogenase alpha subunit
MKVAVPSEIKNNEYRVAITPSGVHELVAAGHSVTVQAGAGAGSSITDAEYAAAGAQIAPDAASTWAAGDLVLKVKFCDGSTTCKTINYITLVQVIRLPGPSHSTLRRARCHQLQYSCSSMAGRAVCVWCVVHRK